MIVLLLTTIKNLETGADWRSSGEESHEIIDLSHTGNEADFPGYTGGKEPACQVQVDVRDTVSLLGIFETCPCFLTPSQNLSLNPGDFFS